MKNTTTKQIQKIVKEYGSDKKDLLRVNLMILVLRAKKEQLIEDGELIFKKTNE